MPSKVKGDPGYECPRSGCGSTSIVCGCEDWSLLRAEVKKAFKEKDSKLATSHFAAEGKMVIAFWDDKPIFARWKWVPEEGKFMKMILPKSEQEICYILNSQPDSQMFDLALA